MFLEGVREYDVDFAKLREFCSHYPAGQPFTKEREELLLAAKQVDYEAVAGVLERMAGLLTKE